MLLSKKNYLVFDANLYLKGFKRVGEKFILKNGGNIYFFTENNSFVGVHICK